VTPEIEALWALQALDESAAALSVQLGRHAAERKLLEERLRAERTHLDGYKTRIADLQKKRRDIEREIETLVGDERKFQSQLPMVKKNEEYQALLHEISGVKRKRSDRETDLLVMMEDEDRAAGERPAFERALASAESESAERGRAIDANEQGERERLAQLDAERGEWMAKLPPATRARYERIRASLGGRAVVAISKGACGGCYRGASPQMLQEAKRGDRVLLCDGCGRMLIWPPEAS
jgi:predicted  nucleic acid-binding Zn-ribbon protein